MWIVGWSELLIPAKLIWIEARCFSIVLSLSYTLFRLLLWFQWLVSRVCMSLHMATKNGLLTSSRNIAASHINEWALSLSLPLVRARKSRFTVHRAGWKILLRWNGRWCISLWLAFCILYVRCDALVEWISHCKVRIAWQTKWLIDKYLIMSYCNACIALSPVMRECVHINRHHT